jgi:hypothetical protein
MFPLLAEETTGTVETVQQSFRSLVVTGIFLVALIVVGIWWLKRQA